MEERLKLMEASSVVGGGEVGEDGEGEENDFTSGVVREKEMFQDRRWGVRASPNQRAYLKRRSFRTLMRRYLRERSF